MNEREHEHETKIPTPAWKTAAVLPIHTDPPPLRLAEEGDIRVGNGRISLDLVVEEHEDGTSPEEMVLAYEVLNLADVYGAITYDLRHKDEVRAYMKQREIEAEALRAMIESRQKLPSREELLRRHELRENTKALAAQIGRVDD